MKTINVDTLIIGSGVSAHLAAHFLSKKSYNVMKNNQAVTMYVRKKISALCNMNFLQKVIEFSALGENKYQLALKLLVTSPFNFIKFLFDLYISNKKDIFIVGKTKHTGYIYTVKNGRKTSKIQWNSGISNTNKKWIFDNSRLPTLLVSNTTLPNLYMLYSDMLSIYKTEKKV